MQVIVKDSEHVKEYINKSLIYLQEKQDELAALEHGIQDTQDIWDSEIQEINTAIQEKLEQTGCNKT